MKLEELLKQIYDHLDSIRKPFEKAEKAMTIRYLIEMIEDGLTWAEIKDHLAEGCHCPQIKSKEEFEKGGY